MAFIRTFLWIRLHSFRHQLQLKLKRRWLEILIPTFIILGLIIGGRSLFISGAQFLLGQGELGQLLLNRLFYLGWTIIFYLLIISNIITALSTLYRSPEVTFLLAKPVQHTEIFHAKLVENLIYSSWAILVLGLPLTLAYGHVKGLSGMDLLLVFPLALLPYLVIATVTGLILLLIVIMLSKWFRMRSLFFTLGIIAVAFFWLYFRFSQQETLLMGNAASLRAASRYLFNLARTPFPLIPSYWFTELFSAYALGHFQVVLFHAAVLLTTALVGLELITWLAKVNYFTTIQLYERTKQKAKKHASKTRHIELPLPGLTPQVKSLISKDILQFLRTPQQWIQLLLFAFFISVYLLNLARIDIRIQDLAPLWRKLVYLFNFGFSGFIIAALTSRFVYPLISLEGKGFWILKAAPLHLKTVFKVKLWISITLFFGLAEMVSLVSNHYLSQGWEVALISTIFLILETLGLVSLALGLGALFPQFNERNPMRIASSMGGTITVILSLIYVAAMVGALVWFIILYEKGIHTFQLTGIFLLTAALSALTIILPLRLGLRSLVKMEI
jgi:ABC-2 type transport system permease protein